MDSRKDKERAHKYNIISKYNGDTSIKKHQNQKKNVQGNSQINLRLAQHSKEKEQGKKNKTIPWNRLKPEEQLIIYNAPTAPTHCLGPRGAHLQVTLTKLINIIHIYAHRLYGPHGDPVTDEWPPPEVHTDPPDPVTDE